LALSDAAMPQVVKARALTRNRRPWSYAVGRAGEDAVWTMACWTFQGYRTERVADTERLTG
jgi:hypothetical protein